MTKDFAGVALPIAVAAFVSALPGIILGGIRGGIVGALSASGSVDSTVITLISSAAGLVNFVIGVLVQAYVMGGIVQFALRVARGDKPEFGVVFGGGKFFMPLFGATLIYQFGGGIGLAFCIVPGLFLLAGWAAYSAFIVDKNMGALESLSASWAATAPYRMNIIIYFVLVFFVFLAGLVACGIGALLVSFPVVTIGNAYLYMKLIGEQPRLASS